MSIDPIFLMNKRLFNAQLMTVDLTSEVVDIGEFRGFAVHEVYTGTPTGTLTVEGSNDGTNFTVVDTNSISTAGSKMVNVDMAHYRYVRVHYVFGSSTGNLTVYISGKKI